MSCIHIYCGEGKGKTTAAVGLAVRFAGSAGQVVIVRFLKNDDSGEISVLQNIPGITVVPVRESFGFTWQMSELQKKKAAVYYSAMLKEGYQTALEKLAETGRVLLVLDEVCAAVNSGLLAEAEVRELLDQRPEEMELVLTGRDPKNSFVIRADYVTEMKKITHPFDHGIPARAGIEF